MRSSLALRLAVVSAVMIAITALGATGTAIVSTNAQVRDDVDRFLMERSEEILDGRRERPGKDRDDNRNHNDGDAAIHDTSTDDLENGTAIEVALATDADSDAQTIDRDGTITGSTGLGIPVSATDLGLATTDGSRLRTVEIDGAEYRVLTTHIPGGGALQVARSLDDTTSLLDVIQDRLLIVGSALAIVGGAIGWLIARRALRPLGELTAAAERVAETQDLDTPIGIGDRPDEIGRLAASFDEMLAALSTSRDQQQRLVQDAAHELRTPLTSVNANIDLLAYAPDLPPSERQDILSGVKAELRQLSTLFTEIIELATEGRDTAAHQPVDLADVARSAIDRLQRQAENPVDADLTPSIVLGDAADLERAVLNLLGNAVKYSPAGSPIRVRVAGGSITVSDRGPGIPPQDRAWVFDRFSRGDDARARPGSGLGLAIVAKIVADHGGHTMVADAEPGPGALVGFSLPS